VVATVPPAPVVAAAAAPALVPSAPAAEPAAPPPLFRSRTDFARDPTKPAHPPIPAVIPLVRAPDDPGIDDELPVVDEFADQIGTPKVQAGGWRGFWSRLGD
jgi:HemY protein